MRRNIRIKPSKSQSILSLIVGAVFVLIGITFVIPSAGLFGIFWTLIAVIITGMSAVNLFSKKGISTAHIEINDDVNTPSDSKQRLQEVENLYREGLITKDEYDTKRKNILDEL